MRGKILLPLDGTELTEAALPYGEELAARLRRELVLFHSRGRDREGYAQVRWVYLDRLAESVVHHIENRQPGAGAARVSTVMQVRRPAGSVCDLVQKNDIGLIIMTADGGSGLSFAKILGCATAVNCPTVPVPVMLINPRSVQRSFGEHRMIGRILVPLDESEASRQALPVAEELAGDLNVGITLFQAARAFIPFVYAEDGSTAFLDYAEMNKEATRQAADDVIELEAELKRKGLDADHLVVNGFMTAGEIVEAGKRVGASLIVMSAASRLPGFLRRFFGGADEKVLRLGHVPVVQVSRRAN